MRARADIVPVFVPHLGCPNNCVFCDQRRISGSQAPAGPEDVTKAVEAAAGLPKRGERQLAFYGGSFTAIPIDQQLALLEAARRELEAGRIDSLRLSTRPDAIDPQVLDRLEAYSVRTIELGAQSMDDEVLRLSGRGHSAAQVEEASRLIKARGFKLILQMMTGLPGDSREKSLYTARAIRDLGPDGVRIYPTVIVKGTALYELWQRGLYKEHTVEDAVELCAGIVPIFREANIPVIRLGLNPTEDLSGGQAVAGAYHPALGELVESRILYRELYELLKSAPRGQGLSLEVDPGLTSKVLGQRRCNAERLRRELGIGPIKVVERREKTGEIRILAIENGERS